MWSGSDWVPGLVGSRAPWVVVGEGLEMLGAFCVETAQFFFGHFRETQYPLFGAVERGRVGLGEQPKVVEIQKVYSEGYIKCTLEYTKCKGNTQSVQKDTQNVSRKLQKIHILYQKGIDNTYEQSDYTIYRVGVIRYPPRGRWK